MTKAQEFSVRLSNEGLEKAFTSLPHNGIEGVVSFSLAEVPAPVLEDYNSFKEYIDACEKKGIMPCSVAHFKYYREIGSFVPDYCSASTSPLDLKGFEKDPLIVGTLSQVFGKGGRWFRKTFGFCHPHSRASFNIFRLMYLSNVLKEGYKIDSGILTLRPGLQGDSGNLYVGFPEGALTLHLGDYKNRIESQELKDWFWELIV